MASGAGVASLLALSIASPLALAQDRTRPDASVKVGEADLYPAIRIDYLRDGNVFVTPDDEVEGTAVVVSPSVELVADRRLLRLEVGYDGSYSSGSEGPLDFADHLLRTAVAVQFDKRRRTNGYVNYRRSRVPFGFFFTRGLGETLDEPVVFDQFELGGRFRYGVVDARGNLEGGVRIITRSYANLEGLTAGRDFTQAGPYGLFSYRLSGDTRALLELRYTTISVEDSVDDRDQLSLFGGLEFAATGQLRGSGRLGATNASYARAGRDDEAVFAAEVALEYLPVSYATLRLTADREFDDVAVRGRATDTQAITDTVNLTWEHAWSSRISHVAYAERMSTTQTCPESGVTSLGVGYELNYAVRRWLELGARADVTSRTGERCPGAEDVENLDFERDQIGLHVRITL